MKRFYTLVAAPVLSALFYAATAQAITVDNFDGDQSLLLLGSGASQTDQLSTTSAVGGNRTLHGEVISSGFMQLVTVGGALSVSQGDGTAAISQVTWDGDTDLNSLNPVGLGGIDFTEDGATALRLRVNSFDFPYAQPANIVFTIYDATDPTGSHFSSATLALSQAVASPTNFDIPFVSFTDVGPGGPADFTRVGALTMVIDGKNKAIDLGIDKLSTNGNCDFVPSIGQEIVDQCGVCAGDGTSCLDCRGVPNGSAVPGSVCQLDKWGVCGQGQYDPECSCRQVNQPSTETCDGLDNDCDSAIDETVDSCGVCGGNGKTCAGCNTKDLTGKIFALDGGSRRQEILVDRALRIFGKLNKTTEAKIYRGAKTDRAKFLQLQNWTLSWSLPQVSVQCAATLACQESRNDGIISSYRKNAKELKLIGKRVLAKVKKLRGGRLTKGEIRNSRLMNTVYKDNLKLAASVPLVQSHCE